MRITVDPDELIVAATTLDACAAECADIGAHLTACVQCQMPNDIRVTIDAIVTAVDRELDGIGSRVHTHAVGLARRAVVAAFDSLAAATVVAPASSVGVIGGGSSNSGFTITNTDGSPAMGLYEMGGVVGGSTPLSITITNTDGSPATSLTSATAFVGGHPSPYPPYTFSAGVSSGAGGQDLRGISFTEPLPTMPAPSGFIRTQGTLANDMAIDMANRTFVQSRLDAIRYDQYASIQQGMFHNEPVDRVYFQG